MVWKPNRIIKLYKWKQETTEQKRQKLGSNKTSLRMVIESEQKYIESEKRYERLRH